VDFGPYLRRVLADVKNNWYARAPSAAAKEGKLTIELAIKKDGSVSGMKLTPSSGDPSQHHAAWDAITASSPFPPLPSEFKGDYLALRFRFYYYPDKADLADVNSSAPLPPVSAGAIRPDPAPQVSTARVVTRVEAEILGDAGEIDYASYLEDSVLPIVRANWYRLVSRPSDLNAGIKGGEATIALEILADGNLGPAKAETTSQDARLDQLAAKGLEKSAPFPILPKSVNARSLRVRCHFYYNPDEGGGAESGTATVPSDAGELASLSGTPASGVSSAQNRSDKSSGQSADQNQEPIYKAGSNGVTFPHLIHNVNPEYSDKARRAKIEGTVLISLVVDSSGNPTMIKVTRSLGSGLDEKAVEAVQQWRFDPATKDGKPVAVHMVVEVSFRLYNVKCRGAPLSLSQFRLFFPLAHKAPMHHTYTCGISCEIAVPTLEFLRRLLSLCKRHLGDVCFAGVVFPE
jgi:TonB family protein